MIDDLLRLLPQFRGKARIANILLKNKIKASSDYLVKGKFKCSYILPNLVENVSFDIMINGVYEKETFQILNEIIPINGTFLDLGANIGAISIPLCKERKDINAIGVEAAPWIFEYLKKNIALNQLNNIEILNCALFNEDDLILDFYSPHDKFGKGSLSPVFTKEAFKVKTKKVDTIIKEREIKRVDVIKVDVEGFEYFVFKGAINLLSGENAPSIVFEFVDWAELNANGLATGSAQHLLLELGYTLYKIENGRKVKLNSVMVAGACNLLAIKDN